MVERVWPGTILGILIIAAICAFVICVGVPMARVLWDSRHYACLAPTGYCAGAVETPKGRSS